MINRRFTASFRLLNRALTPPLFSINRAAEGDSAAPFRRSIPLFSLSSQYEDDQDGHDQHIDDDRQFTFDTYKQFIAAAGYDDVDYAYCPGRVPCAVAVIHKP